MLLNIRKDKNKKLIIVGDGEFGEIAYEYFTYDSEYEVEAFAVERKLIWKICRLFIRKMNMKYLWQSHIRSLILLEPDCISSVKCGDIIVPVISVLMLSYGIMLKLEKIRLSLRIIQSSIMR